MSTLVVPTLDDEPWPTLGPQVVAFLQERCVFGPGDLRGQPYQLDAEKQAAIYRAYEVYPQGHPRAGRRRFRRAVVSWRKGTAKTEVLAAVAFAELHPEAPVRCDGFDAAGNPVGTPVSDPYIPLVAYTEEQTEELAYGALYVMCSEGPDAELFDVGLERIMRTGGDGKAVALASSPNARDGARTTFQGLDETHRMASARLRDAWNTMLGNLPKRPRADPWSMSVTTAYEPGLMSVAELEHDEAKKIAAGDIDDPELFFFHREASPGHDLTTLEGRVAAVAEASGPAAEWSDLHSIARQWDRPGADQPYLERVWLNRTVQSQRQAFDATRWRELGDPARQLDTGALITLGFDGARTHDSTGIVGTDVETGVQVVLGYWPRPTNLADDAEWSVPTDEVEAVLDEAFERYAVWRFYGDPPYWNDDVRRWAGRFGPDRVVEWWTNRQRPMAHACRNFAQAIALRQISHNGDPHLSEHVANARRKQLNIRDEAGAPLWRIEKARPDSPDKIDLAMAAILSWEARGDALASDALGRRRRRGQIIRVR